MAAMGNSERLFDEEYEYFMRPVRTAVSIIATWPLNDHPTTAQSAARVLHLTFLLIIFSVTMVAVVIDGIQHRSSLSEVTECALIGSAFGLSIIRVVVYTIHQKDMTFVVKSMERDWRESPYKDRVVLKNKCFFTFKLVRLFIMTVAASISMFLTGPILERIVFQTEERVIPFPGYYFVNKTISPNYECLYVLNVIAGGFGATTIAGATSFNLVVVMHGAAKFAVLRNRLETMRSDDPDIKAVMAECVRKHQEAIEFADTLERIINILALGQFVISTGLVCFAGFQLTSMIQDKATLMKYTSFLNSAILELFMFSFSGHELITESDLVGESSYKSDWVGSSITQSLQIVMMRSMVPCKITAAKFYYMSLESFSAVLSSSFSYFTVLSAVNDGDEG